VFVDVFHDMLVHETGLGRVEGTKNETLALQDPVAILMLFWDRTNNIPIRGLCLIVFAPSRGCHQNLFVVACIRPSPD